jgi:hypothetical protein
MFGHLLDFSPRGWGRVWLWTTLGTLFCIAAAIYVDSFNFSAFDTATLHRAIAVDVLLPCFWRRRCFSFSPPSCATWQLPTTTSASLPRRTA